MVVTVPRRSSVVPLKLSLHFDDEVRPADSELERGGLDRVFASNVWSVVGGVWEMVEEKLFEPLGDVPFGSALCSQDEGAYVSSGIVLCGGLHRGRKVRSKISYRSLLCGRKIPALTRFLNRDML
jgi:hypothetical protein